MTDKRMSGIKKDGEMTMRTTMKRTTTNMKSRNFFLMSLALLLSLVLPGFALAANDNIADATGPADFVAGSPSVDNYLDNFIYTSTGNGQLGGDSVTVTTTGTANIAAVKIKDATGTVTHGTQSTPSGNNWIIDTSGNKIGSKGTSIEYRIYVDIVGGASGTVTAYVSAFTTGATNDGTTDAVDTTITGYTAGCSTVNPSISLSTGQTIGGGATASYTITVTNNDSAACTDTTFDVEVPAGGESGNTGSFVLPSTPNTSAPCQVTISPQSSDSTTCTLEVTSQGSPTDGHIMNTVVEVSSGVHTTPQSANVDTTISIAASPAACSMCHDYPPVDGARDYTTGNVLGSHDVHASLTSWLVTGGHIADCTTCHTDTTVGETKFAHRNGNIQMAATIQGGMYDKGADDVADTSWAQTDTPSLGTCDNTNCHGPNSNPGPTWGGAVMNCTSCHNNGGGQQYPTATSQFRSANAAGAHETHMTSTGLMNGNIECQDCHTDYGTDESSVGHFDTSAPADVPFPAAGDADLNSTTPSYTSADKSCSVYCHGANMPNGSNNGTYDHTTTFPLWTHTNADGCAFCHGTPPNTGSHSGTETLTDCNGCHDTVDGTGAIAIQSQHIDGTVQASGDCWTCHGDKVSKAYPPTSYFGNAPKTSNDGVGAHVAHIEGSAALLTKEGGQATTAENWCLECHTVPTTIGDAGHVDSTYPADVTFAGGIESSYSGSPTYTAEGGGNAGIDSGIGGTCSNVYCHGATLSGGKTSLQWDDPADASTGCDFCHGNPPAAPHANDPDCSKCHDHIDAGDAAIADATKHIDGQIQVKGCTGCHSSAASGAAGVGPDSSHTDADGIGGTYTDQHCEACHPGDGDLATHIGTKHSASNQYVVLIPNNTNVGINYVNGTNNYTGDNGIVLGGVATDNDAWYVDPANPTEAEICWGCHESFSPDISEWDGSSAAYNYGSVTTDDLNWFTTSWTSANFSYKDGPLTTKINNDTDTASTHGTKGGATGVDDAAKIGCSYCHDVHSNNKASGDSGTTPPYLRGSWASSVYNEDGAPGRWTDRGDTLSSSGNGEAAYTGNYGAVPRGSNATANGMGGYWIDQNSASHGATTYADHAGLCTLCHGDGDGIPSEAADVTAIEGLWAGHINPVAGGNNSTNAARNIYIYNTSRNGNGTWNGGMWLGAQRSTGQSGTRYYSYRSNRQPWVPPGVSDYAYNSFAWTTAVVPASGSDTSPSVDFHNFTCSKCHNPHASRLPRLMITNCLDVARNSWDDTWITHANMDQWDGTGTGVGANVNYGTGEHAYASTAQNCHRYINGTEAGWNTVTPWN